jgi:GTPase
LQHVERTRILVHVVDPLGFNELDAKASIKTINTELKSYSRELAKKHQILVVNKQDLTGAADVYKSIKRSFKKSHVFAVSGVSGEGMPELLAEIAKQLDQIPLNMPQPAPRPVHVQLEPDFWVEKKEERYTVKGKKVEKLVAMTNFRLPEAVQRTQNILKKIGVERELISSGAQTGDQVQIGGFEFTFEPEKGFYNPPPRRPPRR